MPDPEIAALPTKIILNGYRLDTVHVRGGFSITYMGTEVATGEKVVIKENIPGTAAYRNKGEVAFRWKETARRSGPGSRQWAEENFLKEVRGLAAMKHPNIVPVKDGFRMAEMGTAYMVMPYISSTSLSQLIENGKKAEVKAWVGYLLASLLDALQYLHGRQMLHRDIKPSNILIAADGSPILIDFGAARHGTADHMTRVLSVNYAPLEQQLGRGEGPWSDIYSLGASMYRLITGEYLPAPQDRNQDKSCYTPLAQRADLVSVYGVPLLSSIDKAVSVEPDDRFSRAALWSAALVDEPAFQKGVPVPIPLHLMPAGGAAGAFAAWSGQRKKRLLILVLLFFLLALGASGACAYFLLNNEEEPPAEKAAVTTMPAAPESPAPVEQPPAAPPPWPQRVLARSAAQFYDCETGTRVMSNLRPAKFGVYYVTDTIGEGDALLYRVAQVPGGAPIAALRCGDVYPWPHNLLVQYNHRDPEHAALRPSRALYFNDPEAVHHFVTGMDEVERKMLLSNIRSKRQARAKGDEAAGADLARLIEANGVIAMEPETWNKDAGEHLLPVLGYGALQNGKVEAANTRESFTYKFDTRCRNTTGILRVAAMLAPEVSKNAEKPKPIFDIVFVIDTTKSMGPYMKASKQFITNFIRIMEENGAKDNLAPDACRYGFIAFRDLMYLREQKGESRGPAVISSEGFTEDNTRTSPAISFTEAKGQNCLVDAKTCEQWISELREAGTDGDRSEDADFHEDLPAAMELLCREKGFPWRTTKDSANNEIPSIRIVLVITDAAYREGDEREDEDLRFSGSDSTRWNKRMRGSAASMTMDDSYAKLRAERVYSLGVLINVEDSVYGPQLNGGPAAWRAYMSKAGKQLSDHSFVFAKFRPGELSDSSTAGNLATEALEKARQERGEKEEATGADAIAKSGTELAQGIINPAQVLDTPEADLTPMQRLFRAAYVDWLSDQAPTQADTDSLHRLADADAAPGDMVGWTVDRPDNGISSIRPMMVLTPERYALFVETLTKIADRLRLADKKTANDPINSLAGLLGNQLHDANTTVEAISLNEATEEEKVQALRAQIEALPYKSNALLKFMYNQTNANELVSRIETCLKNLEACKREADMRSAQEQDLREDLIFIPIDILP